MSWREARLGDVADFVRGITFKPEDVVELGTPDSVACMRTKNVQAELNLSDVWAVPARLVKRAEQYLRYGDILVSSANSWNLVGKCSWVPELPWRATFGGYVSVLRVTSPNLLPRYLYHWFSSPPVQALVRSFGRQTTNISNLDVDRCLNLRIPLPPFPEQLRIAEVLDRAETLRRQRQSALDWLSMLVDVMFAELFQGALSAARWPIVRLGDVAAIQGGLQLSGKRAALPIEVPYLRVANVYRGYIDLTEVKTLRATPEEVSRTRLLANDLLIVEGHGNATEIGRCALWDGSVDPCVHQNHLIRARVDQERLDPVFLCHYLNSPQGRQHLLRSAKTTSGLNTISTSNVKETPVVVPPMSLQKQFVERVTRVERVRATNLASLAQLEDLYASLQHRAFRGEL